jgi:uncharacterized protein YgbK (DUF1537 family)
MIVGAIADDLSGAAGVAGDFARFGLSACVMSWHALPAAAPNDDVIVIDTDSRGCSAEESASRHVRAATWLRPAAPRQLLLKIDSQLRGHPGANLGALLRLMEAPSALVACAVPEQGRTVVGGVVHLCGQPMTDAAGRPLNVADMLAHGLPDWPVQVIKAESAGGNWAVLAHAHRGIVVADAANAWDQYAAIRHALSAGIGFIATSYGAAGPVLATQARLSATAPVLALSGSVSRSARRQLTVALQRGGFEPIYLDTGGAPSVHSAVCQRVAALLAEGRDVLVHTAPATAALDDIPMDVDAAAASVVEAFCVQLLRKFTGRLGAVIATGGATAAALLCAAGAKGTRCNGIEAAPCAPLMRMDGGVLDGVPLITKPGAFGDESSLAQILNAARIAAYIDTTRRHVPESPPATFI